VGQRHIIELKPGDLCQSVATCLYACLPPQTLTCCCEQTP
jgi:hypothetical protein